MHRNPLILFVFFFFFGGGGGAFGHGEFVVELVCEERVIY